MTGRWRSTPWTSEASPDRLAHDDLEVLAAKVPTALSDDTEVTVTVTAGQWRGLLAAHERHVTGRGAEITDSSRRVTYRATIGRAPGRVWLRAVTVAPWDDDPDPSVWRLSPSLLAAETAGALAGEAARPEGSTTARAIDPNAGPPTAEDLVALLRAGETRSTIARLYGREVSTVDDWLRRARRGRPDLPWPKQRRGPKPGTTSKRAKAASKTTSSARTARGAGRRDKEQ